MTHDAVASERPNSGGRLLRLVDIAAFLGVTKQRAHQLTQREDFPWPVGTYARGDLWAKGDVKRWARRYGGGAARWVSGTLAKGGHCLTRPPTVEGVTFWLQIIAGVGGVLAGVLTLADPARFSAAMRDSWTDGIADRLRANPLRWLHLWWRFVGAKPGRKTAWGLFEIVLGLFFLMGALLSVR